MDRFALCQGITQKNGNRWLRAMLTHEGYHEIAELIMGYLPASSVVALHAALKIKATKSVRRHYLHPLRDVDPTTQIFQPWIRDDCQILMIGPDNVLLKERIQNPKAYYQHYQGREPPQLEAWVVGIPSTSKSDCRKRVKRITRLKRKLQHEQKDIVVREKALAALWDILDLDTLRQWQCLDDRDELDCNDKLDSNTSIGESILVRSFNLLSCNTSFNLSSHPVSLRLLGMHFYLPWNIKKPILPAPYWTPNDGMPYIDARLPVLPPNRDCRSHRLGSPTQLFWREGCCSYF